MIGARLLNDALAHRGMYTASLLDLRLVKCGITCAAVRALCPSLALLSQLQRLDLSWNPLGGDGIAALCQGLPTPCPLRDLGLRGTDLHLSGVAPLADWLGGGSAQLETLRLGWNQLDGLAAAPLAQVLLQTPLQELDLEQCAPDRALCDAVGELVRTHTALTVLRVTGDLGQHPLGAGVPGVRPIVRALRENSTLTELK